MSRLARRLRVSIITEGVMVDVSTLAALVDRVEQAERRAGGRLMRLPRPWRRHLILAAVIDFLKAPATSSPELVPDPVRLL